MPVAVGSGSGQRRVGLLGEVGVAGERFARRGPGKAVAYEIRVGLLLGDRGLRILCRRWLHRDAQAALNCGTALGDGLVLPRGRRAIARRARPGRLLQALYARARATAGGTAFAEAEHRAFIADTLAGYLIGAPPAGVRGDVPALPCGGRHRARPAVRLGGRLDALRWRGRGGGPRGARETSLRRYSAQSLIARDQSSCCSMPC